MTSRHESRGMSVSIILYAVFPPLLRSEQAGGKVFLTHFMKLRPRRPARLPRLGTARIKQASGFLRVRGLPDIALKENPLQLRGSDARVRKKGVKRTSGRQVREKIDKDRNPEKSRDHGQKPVL